VGISALSLILAPSPLSPESEPTGKFSNIRLQKMEKIDSLFTITEVIHRSFKSTVMRAVRKSDGLRVVIKSVRSATGSGTRAHFKAAAWREYEVLKELQDTVGVVRPLEYIALVDGGAIVLGDSNGSSLTQNVGVINNQRTFLQIAMELCDILGRVHLKHIIHKDLKPANILLW
jgi:serine/threonine protein kinase